MLERAWVVYDYSNLTMAAAEDDGRVVEPEQDRDRDRLWHHQQTLCHGLSACATSHPLISMEDTRTRSKVPTMMKDSSLLHTHFTGVHRGRVMPRERTGHDEERLGRYVLWAQGHVGWGQVGIVPRGWCWQILTSRCILYEYDAASRQPGAQSMFG